MGGRTIEVEGEMECVRLGWFFAVMLNKDKDQRSTDVST